MLDIAGRDPMSLKKPLIRFCFRTTHQCGRRMETMDIGIECLLANDMQTAYTFARQLNDLNLERRQVESQMNKKRLLKCSPYTWMKIIYLQRW